MNSSRFSRRNSARTNLAALFEEEEALAFESSQDEPDELTSSDEGTEDSASAEKAPSGLLASAKSLRRRAESIIESGVSDSDATEIRTLLDASSSAITRRDWPALKEADDKLSDVLFYLED